MDIIELKEEHHNLWDDFCLESHDTWFWHTSTYHEYTLNYRPNLKSKNLSFFILQDNKILCICPLFLEFNEKSLLNEFSFGGDFNQNPAFAPNLTYKQKSKLEKIIFNYIDNKAEELDVVRSRFHMRPLTVNSLKGGPYVNYFLHYGYIDCSLESSIVNLQSNERDLWLKLRQGIRRSIKSMENDLKTIVYTNKNMTDDDFNIFQNLHLKAAGRVTRPQITWDLMKEWIYQGNGMLIFAELSGEIVGGCLFPLYRGKSYYSSGANDPEKSEIPIAHTIFWKAIKWLKENNYTFFETGFYSYPSIYDIAAQKEEQIAYFKRGFGGDFYPLYQAEKFYSDDFCKKVIKSRIEQYFNYLKNLK